MKLALAFAMSLLAISAHASFSTSIVVCPADEDGLILSEVIIFVDDPL